MNFKLKQDLLKILLDNFDNVHLNQLVDKVPRKAVGILKIRNNTSDSQITFLKKRILENNRNVDFIYDFLSKDGFNSIIDKEDTKYRDIDFSTPSNTIKDLKKLADFHPGILILTIIKVLDDKEVEEYFNANPDELLKFMEDISLIFNSKIKKSKIDVLSELKKELFNYKQEVENNRIELNSLNQKLKKFDREKEKLIKRYEQKLSKLDQQKKEDSEKSKKIILEMESAYNKSLIEKKKENTSLLASTNEKYQKIIDNTNKLLTTLQKENDNLKNEIQQLKSEDPKTRILILGKITPTFEKLYPKVKFTIIQREEFSVEKLSTALEKGYSSIWLMTSQYTRKMVRDIKKEFPNITINTMNSLTEFKFMEEL